MSEMTPAFRLNAKGRDVEKRKTKHPRNVIHIYEPTFQQNICYINAKTYAQYKRIAEKHFNTTIEDDDDVDKTGTAGMFDILRCFDKAKKHESEIAVIWGDKNSPDVIAHEALHTVFWIVERTGIEKTCQESWCYLLGFIMQAIYGKKRGNK